jgi:hypothetical protein
MQRWKDPQRGELPYSPDDTRRVVTEGRAQLEELTLLAQRRTQV